MLENSNSEALYPIRVSLLTIGQFSTNFQQKTKNKWSKQVWVSITKGLGRESGGQKEWIIKVSFTGSKNNLVDLQPALPLVDFEQGHL